MKCTYKPRVNSLWSIWYCLAIVMMTVYLLYLGIRRYLAFSEDDWLNASHTRTYAIISISLHGLVLVLLPFFILTCCFKVGNLASDGDRLGDRTKKVLDVIVGTPICRKLKSAWQHGPPVAQTLHLSMAFALLMAHCLMETQFFKHHGSSVLQTEEIWSSDLEFLYRNQDDKLTRLIRIHSKDRHSEDASDVAHRHHQFLASAVANSYGGGDYESMDNRPDRSFNRYSDSRFNNDGYESVVSPVDIPPKLLPFLSNFRHYGISLLFLNYLIALFIYASVYPSVFWRVNKSFAFVFSCHLIMHAIASVFSYVSFVIVYRYQAIMDVSRPPFILNEYLLIITYVSSCVIFFFSSTVVYGYGYNKYCLRLLSTASVARGRLLRGLRGPKTHTVCCEGYAPHIAAILMLILMVGAKAPLLYDQMILYQKYFRSITLICIVSDVSYLFAWILLWLALTLKREWAFKVRYTNSEIGALLGIRTEEGRAVSDHSLMVLCGDDYFATDDESKRMAILQLAEKCGLGQHEEEVYWLKPSNPTSGEVSGQKNNDSPEMNNLLDRSNGADQRNPYQQSPQTKAATIGVSGGSYWKRYGGASGGAANTSTLGYSKVSFSDGEHEGGAYLQKQQQRLGQSKASGSYVRFSDDQQSAVGLAYDDHSQDIVSTFGTLPRQDYPRRRIIRDENQFFVPPSKQYTQMQTVANVGALKRTQSPLCAPQSELGQGDMVEQGQPGIVTYASVHKRSCSPVTRTADYGRLIQQPRPVVPAIGDTQTDSQNVSRVSSYANIPSSSSKPPWDAASLSRVDAARPPTGRPMPYPGNGHQPPQQFHHHQHHYNAAGSVSASPQPHASLPHPTSITNTPNNNQHRRQQMHYKPNGNSETLALQPRASPKHSPSLEPENYHGFNGQMRKLTSFSNSSASGGAGGGESSDTTPTQQSFAGLLATGGNNALTTSASSSSREMTPLSNASANSLSRPVVSGKQGAQQQPGSNWRANPMYNQSTTTSIGARSQTPQSAAYTAPSNHIGEYSHQHQSHGGAANVSGVYYNGAPYRATVGNRPSALDAAGSSGPGRTLLGLESHDRNDSANFSLTSSNESDNNQFVTSIV